MTYTTIISASQTGNSRELALLLYNALVKENIKTIRYNACDYNFKNIAQERLLIIITSTYGEGEPPEEAVDLYNFIVSIKAPLLRNTKYAVFSLGDSSYEHFSKIGKDFDYKLSALGGKRIYKRIDADINYREVFDIWLKKILKVIKSECIINEPKDEYNSSKGSSKSSANTSSKSSANTSSKSSANTSSKSSANTSSKSSANTSSKSSAFNANITTIKKITSSYSSKDTFHIEASFNNDICFYPGDSLSVFNNNEAPIISELTKYLRTNKYEYIYINRKKTSFYRLIKSYYEVTQPSLITIEKAAIDSKTDLLQALINNNNNNIIKAFMYIATIDFLRYIKPSLKTNSLIIILNKLKPRLYSIASSQLEAKKELHLTVNLIEYKIDSYTRKGNTSSYLINNTTNKPSLKVIIQYNKSFYIPKNKDIPIIMIGSGTGIAPFRSFIQHNNIVKSFNKCWLFFGNPSFNNGFLYQTEWKAYIKANILTNISLAWSRDQEIKSYIQDNIRTKGPNIWSWIKEKASIYICGSARRLAFEIDKTIVNIICESKNISYNKAIIILNLMKAKQQYQKDVY